MILRCATCGYVNQQVDAETAFCPNCGAAYAAENAPTVALGPSYSDVPPYRTPSAHAPYGTSGVLPYRTPSTPLPYYDAPPPPPLVAFGVATPPVPAPKPASRVGPFVVGVIVTLVVIVLAGVGYVAYAATQHTSTTAASTSSTTAQVPTADPNQTYFTLTPPVGWTMHTVSLPKIGGIGTRYFSPDLIEQIQVIVVPNPATGETIPALDIVNANKGTQFKRTATGTVTYSNTGTLPWTKVSGTFVTQSGTPDQIIVLNHHYKKRLYAVVFIAPQTATETIFEQTMMSFQFV
jgi:hypothetical protein